MSYISGGGGSSIAIPVTVPNGGTGLITITDHAVMVGSGVAAVTPIGPGATGTVLKGVTGADPSFAAVDLTADVTGILPITNGGTGLATLTDHSILVGQGLAPITPIAMGLDNEILFGHTAADPSFANPVFNDSVFGVSDNGDSTKILAFECSAITTLTTRTITMDDRDIDMDAVATTFTGDAGNAIAAGGILSILGGTNLNSAGAGSTITMNLDTSLDHMVQVQIDNGGSIATATTLGHTLELTAYDTGTSTYTTFITLTAGNPPTMDLSTDVTIGSAYVYRVGGTDVSVADGGTGASTLLEHALLVGSGVAAISTLAVGTTGTIVTGVTGADPVWTTATYPATTSQGDVIYSSADNTIVGLAKDATATRYIANTGASNNPAWAQVDLSNGVTNTLAVGNGGSGATTFTDHGILVGSGASAFTALGSATDGQLPIGSTGADPVLATLTAGTNIGISNGAGTITINCTATSGLSWNEVTGTTQAAAVDNGYIANNGALVTITLPATATVGQTIRVLGLGAGGWKIAQNASQYIRWDESIVSTTGAGGYFASTDDHDAVELLCTVTNNGWSVLSSKGNIDVV